MPATAAPTPPCDEAGACVVVQVFTGTQQTGGDTFSATELAGLADVTTTTEYPVSSGGTETVPRGTSVRALVQAVTPLDGVTFAEVVENGAYGRHVLTEENLGPAGGNGFQGELLPVFYGYGGTSDHVSYVRPQRSSSDANAAQGPDLGLFSSDANGSLFVKVHLTGQPLGVSVTATPTGPDDRTYQLASDPTGSGYSAQWVLPDGTTSAEAAPTYAFPPGYAAGSYSAAVALDGPDGSFGWGETQLRAGAAPSPSPTSSPTPGTGGAGGASNGPTKTPSPSATGKPNPQQSPSGLSSASTDPETQAPPTLPPIETAPPTSAAPQPTRTPKPTPTPTPTPSASGEQVTGLLLSAADTGAQGEVRSDAPTPSPSARALADTPLRVSTTALLVVGALLLALAGAASESPRARRWLRSGLPSSRMGP